MDSSTDREFDDAFSGVDHLSDEELITLCG